MLLTVPEVASKLHVSKQSIYSKIKLPEYKNKIVMKHGQTMCDDDLVKLIKDNLKVTNNFTNSEPQQDTGKAEKAQDTILDEDIVNMNQELIKALLDQLKEKDIQIHDLHKLIENNQVLLKDKPQQNVLLLEEHFQDLDTKLEEVKNNMIERKEQQSKGFFSKMFKK